MRPRQHRRNDPETTTPEPTVPTEAPTPLSAGPVEPIEPTENAATAETAGEGVQDEIADAERSIDEQAERVAAAAGITA